MSLLLGVLESANKDKVGGSFTTSQHITICERGQGRPAILQDVRPLWAFATLRDRLDAMRQKHLCFHARCGLLYDHRLGGVRLSISIQLYSAQPSVIRNWQTSYYHQYFRLSAVHILDGFISRLTSSPSSPPPIPHKKPSHHPQTRPPTSKTSP